jgi:hypothetical protein
MGTTYTLGEETLNEDPGSPRWEFGERIICRRTFRGSYDLCLSSAPMRGAYGTGDFAGYRVDKSTVDHAQGDRGLLVIDYQTSGEPPQGATLPETESSIDLQQIEQDLRKHPRYTALTTGNFNDITTLLENDQDKDAYNAAHARILADDQFELIDELWGKLERKITHYALWTPTVRLKVFYWSPPDGLTTGGFIEDPPAMWITPPSGTYLRAADSVQYNGTTWEVTSTWVGAPDWDADLYDEAPAA